MSSLKNSKRISINSLNNSSPVSSEPSSPISSHRQLRAHTHRQQVSPQSKEKQSYQQQEHFNPKSSSHTLPSQHPQSTHSSEDMVASHSSEKGSSGPVLVSNQPHPSKIQHQFKSKEKITLLQQVIKYNPYRNRKNGWQQVKDGYLVWKNINRPKYADPAEDYIKRKVQEILRLYSRLGKDSLKDNGFLNKESPDAQLFIQLIEKVLALRRHEEMADSFQAKEEYNEQDNFAIGNVSSMSFLQNTSDMANSTTIGSINANPPATSSISGQHGGSKDLDSYSDTETSPTGSKSITEGQKRRKVSMPFHHNISYPFEAVTGSAYKTTTSLPSSSNKLPSSNTRSKSSPTSLGSHPESARPPLLHAISTESKTIGEMHVEEFMILMNKNNQQFATAFATEFTKSLSETLCVTITKAIRETIQETSKNNLEIIKALKN